MRVVDFNTGQCVGYTRVSTLDQNTVRQLDDIDIDRTFTDHVSGKDLHRPQLEALLAFVRDGGTVLVHSTDCLARNLDDLRATVRGLTTRGVRVQFVKEQLTFTGDDTAMATLLLTAWLRSTSVPASSGWQRRGRGTHRPRRRRSGRVAPGASGDVTGNVSLSTDLADHLHDALAELTKRTTYVACTAVACTATTATQPGLAPIPFS